MRCKHWSENGTKSNWDYRKLKTIERTLFEFSVTKRAMDFIITTKHGTGRSQTSGNE